MRVRQSQGEINRQRVINTEPKRKIVREREHINHDRKGWQREKQADRHIDR